MHRDLDKTFEKDFLFKHFAIPSTIMKMRKGFPLNLVKNCLIHLMPISENFRQGVARRIAKRSQR